MRASDLPPEFALFLKYEFDKHIYYYGDHFSNGYDRLNRGHTTQQYQQELMAFFWKHQPAIKEWSAKKTPLGDNTPCVFSSAYFGWERALAANGVRLISCPWMAAEAGNAISVAISSQCRAVQELLRSGFSILYNKEFHSILRSVAENLEQFFLAHPARAVLLPFTNGFFEGITTQIFKKIGKRSFLCIHGLPARFDWWKYGEHPTDYIVVWGEAMKRKLVETGRPPASILVSGHPNYSGLPRKPISSSLDNVLVLGTSQNGAPLLEAPHYYDRSLNLDYLWRVQTSLKKAGVKHARMRPHPSESVQWYQRHLDLDFYQVDESPSCAEALKPTSLVIGPTSTVLLDAAVAGINYVSFLPELPHYNPFEESFFAPDMPFDGSDPRFPVAKNEDELVRLLKNSSKIEVSVLNEYISPTFNPEYIASLITGGASAPLNTIPVNQPPAAPIEKTAANNTPLHIPEASEVSPKPFELQTLAAVRPFTMTPPQVTLNAMRAIEAAVQHGLEGAVVECGVWRGGVSMAMMHQLKKLGARREFFMYDTYDGMSEPTAEDLSPQGESATKLLATHRKDEANHYWAFAPIDRVRRNIESVGYPMELVRMVQGKVEDTIPGVIPDRIAVLRLDTDWYESTKHELDHLYSRLIPGGIMILDDYGFWQGARKAVDEFFETLKEKPVLHVVHDELNSCVRWCVKP
ncbi:MAG: TylF/MycF/NovP-related O-methyltransferase [Nibricoccus sp.]